MWLPRFEKIRNLFRLDTRAGSSSSKVVSCLALSFCLSGYSTLIAESSDSSGYRPKPIPEMQALPLPHDEVSIQNKGTELLRFHFGNELRRPFIYPVNGPSGLSLTRLGHPHDPHGHSHHNSVWISHHMINEIDFWGDRGENKGRIVHQKVDSLEDSDIHAGVVSSSLWKDPEDQIVFKERRRIVAEARPERQYLMIIDLKLEAVLPEVTIRKTPFGMIGVRMAKSIGVNDGGGRIINSNGQINEEETFWKSARWVDYSGQIASGVVEGLTLMDHPKNPNHPSVFHIRNDGWMGACLTFDGDRILKKGESIQLRYGIYVHSNLLTPAEMEIEWVQFGKTKPFSFR